MKRLGFTEPISYNEPETCHIVFSCALHDVP